MGHPIQPNLRNDRSGIVHAALAGYVLCQTRTNAGAYTATDEPISCKNCLKQPVSRTGVAEVLAADPLAADDIDVTRLTRAQFDGEACIRCHSSEPGMVRVGHGENGPLFQCLTCSLRSITDKEIKIAFLAGNISTITILRDLFDEFGLDPDRRAWSAEELLTTEEADEVSHVVKLIVWRRRGVKVPDDPMSLAAMNAGVVVGVEAAEKYGVAEAYRRVGQGVGVLTLEESEQTLRFVRGLAESRYIENPDSEGPPCADLRCDLCYTPAPPDQRVLTDAQCEGRACATCGESLTTTDSAEPAGHIISIGLTWQVRRCATCPPPPAHLVEDAR